MSLIALMRNDRAENSIMQTITIAVSAILIAAGLVTAPGLINNARDNNARTDLANIAYAQEFVLSVGGKYYEHITPEQEEAATGEPSTGDNLQDAAEEAGLNGAGTSWGASAAVEGQTGIKFTLSGDVSGHAAVVCESPTYYLLKAQSDSGKWFYKGQASGNITSNFNDLLLQIPADVLAACPDIAVGFPESENGITGAALLDVDVNVRNAEDFFISGYSPTTPAEVAEFGGGDVWHATPGGDLVLSYWEDGSFHEFYTNSDYSNNGDDEIKVDYDADSNTLFGTMFIEFTAGQEAEFTKFADNGGKASFVSVETGANVEIAWAPATGSTPIWAPEFPEEDVPETGHYDTYNNWVQKTNSYSLYDSGQYMYVSQDAQTIGIRSNYYSSISNMISYDGGENFYASYSMSSCVSGGHLLMNDGSVLSAGGTLDGTGPEKVWRACTSPEGGLDLQGLSMTDGLANVEIDSPEGDRLVSTSGSNDRIGMVASADGQTIVVLGYHYDSEGIANSFLVISHDGGQTGDIVTKPANWAANPSNDLEMPVGMWLSADGNTLAFQTEDGIYISNDSGVTGHTVSLPGSYTYSDVSVDISNNGDNIIIGAGEGQVGISTNGGASFSWQTLEDESGYFTATGNISQVLISNDGQRMVGFERYGSGLFISDNGGDSWTHDNQGNYSNSQIAADGNLSAITILWTDDNYPSISKWAWGDSYEVYTCDTGCGGGGDEPTAS